MVGGNLDKALFRFINEDLSNPVFDVIMPIVSELHEGWTGVLSLLLLVAFLAFKLRRQTGWMIFALALSVGSADAIAYRLIKPAAQRARPNYVLENVNLRVPNHSGYSFPSNHATNSFAGAAVLALALPTTAAFFLSYAALVSLSRVYVGVHFPLDVLAGGVLGLFLGVAVFLLLRGRLTLQRRAP